MAAFINYLLNSPAVQRAVAGLALAILAVCFELLGR